MVLACESIFSGTSFDARPQNLHTFPKVNLRYIQHTCPVRQFSLARGNRASTNVEACGLLQTNYVGPSGDDIISCLPSCNLCSLIFLTTTIGIDFFKGE